MTRALARLMRSHRPTVVCLGMLAIVASAMAGSGFGATSASVTPSANVVGTLSMTDPTALGSTPLCTNSLAPLDTDDCTDVSFTSGGSKVLRLGSLSGTDVQAGALRWLVSTTNPGGYQVHMSNAGPAPVLRSASSTIADMPTAAPFVQAGSVDDGTHFGVAMGDSAADNESAVDYPGSPWMNAGQQGELFSGIPASGMVVARRTTPQVNDPFTATFAVASIASQQPTAGSYAGTVRLVASAL